MKSLFLLLLISLIYIQCSDEDPVEMNEQSEILGFDENAYTTTYLHPDEYFITAFADNDGNFFPSTGDIIGESQAVSVKPETHIEIDHEVNNIL